MVGSHGGRTVDLKVRCVSRRRKGEVGAASRLSATARAGGAEGGLRRSRLLRDRAEMAACGGRLRFSGGCGVNGRKGGGV